MKGKETDYLKLGSFVITALVILILAIIFLGSGKLFQKTIYVETYFNESVQGLLEGSPVKYRGLQIGYVKQISFVNQVYKYTVKEHHDLYSRYIYVKMAITADALAEAPQTVLEKALQQDIKKGLRIKLALQGLTGNAYLELDFVNPNTHPPIEIYWTPRYYYIPSTTSLLTSVADNLSSLLDELNQVQFNQLATEAHQTFKNLNGWIEQNGGTIANTINNLEDVTTQAKNYPASIFFGKPPPKLNPRNL